MEKMDLHELAERYVLSNLNPGEKEFIEEEMRINNELRKEVELLQGLSYAVQDQDLLDFRAMVQEEAAVYKISRKGIRMRKIFIRASAAAASIILVAATFFVLSVQSHKAINTGKIYSHYYSIYSSGLASRSGGGISEDLYGKAVCQYLAKDFRSARTSFDSVLIQNPADNKALFFSGISSMELKDYQIASARFEKIIQNGNSLYIEQAEWYSGLALLAINDRKNALTHFRSLVKSNGFNASKARLIIGEMKEE
jgi:tetratricopeptide (TPR) repeat protein